MDNLEFIRADAGGAVAAVLFVLISIIVSIVQGQKEKQKREERLRKLQESGSASARPQAQPKQGRPTSIEDFLRELAGEKPARQSQPEPQPAESEWHAPAAEVNSWSAQKKRQENLREQRELDRQRQLTEKKEAADKRRHPDRKRRAEAAAKQNAFLDADNAIYGDAYAIVAPVKMPRLVPELSTMSLHDLRKALALKEILGSPVAMKTEGDQPPGLR